MKPTSIIKLPLLGAFILSSQSAMGFDLSQPTISYGVGNNDVETFRLGFRKDISDMLADNDLLKQINLPLSGYLEASGFVWKPDEEVTNIDNSDLYGIAFNIGVSYEFNTSWKYRPYVEYATGIAFVHQNRIGFRDMSSTFQFENRVGFGLRSDNLDIFVRAEHFSNANIVDPNWGLDVIAAGVSFSF